MNRIKADMTLDTSGKCCPMPMVETNKAIKTLDTGQVLEIVATDPATQTDIPSWCRRTGNELLEQGNDAGVLHYYVRKG